MINQDNKVDIRVVLDERLQRYGIAISSDMEEKKILDDIRSIKFHYIKYQGTHSFTVTKENGEKENKYYHFIEFNSMTKELIQEILNMISNKLKSENYNISFYECLQYIVSLFRNLTFPKSIEKELAGDICEALFILKIKEELNEDIVKYYKSEDHLYDFYIPEFDKAIDIKGTKKKNGQIKLNLRQLQEKNNKDFYVIEYQLIDSGKNIIELLKEIGIDKSSVIKNKYDRWTNYKSAEDDGKKIILDKYLIDINSVKCFKFKNDQLPIITIDNDSSVLDVEITLSSKNAEETGLEYLKQYLNPNVLSHH